MSLVIKSGLRLVGLLVLVTVWLGLALPVAQPYTVCPSGCPFSKIQAALDAAKDGDTITVGPGVYKENLKITKSVSLVGADPAQVRLMPSGPAYALIQVGEESTLGTVRIEGFTLQQAIGLVEQAIYTEVDSSIQSFIFRNNRVLNREEKDWIVSLVGDTVTVEKSIFSANSTLKIDGRRIHVFNNDLRLVEIDPFLGDTGNEALVEGNTFREEEVFVAGNAIVRKNQFRSAGLGIGVGGNPLEVELVQVLENEFLGPGVSSFPPSFQSSIAIGVGTTSDRVLIEGNKIANYDVGIGIDRWTSLSLDITIRRNTISQGWYGIWLKAQRQEPTKIQILGNTIDRQQHPKGSDSSGAGILIDGEVEQVEVLFQGNTISLGDFGVLLMPGSGKFELQGNTITDNDLFGVLLAVPPCGEVVDPTKVQVTGSGNEIA
ncbi:MAG: right-handed parallel beta-helix repeat-containing protein, partial [Candidatus Methanosuratincola sp.]